MRERRRLRRWRVRLSADQRPLPDDDSFNGECDWVDPEDSRPGELTDGMSISCDGVRLGPGWWQDLYFRWYFIHDPQLVSRAMAGDHSWVPAFLEANKLEAKPPPQSSGPTQTLRPLAGRPFLRTVEVAKRLENQFAFFAAHPTRGEEPVFYMVLGNNPDDLDYLNFEVHPGEAIVLHFRDDHHQSAVQPLVELCARLLEYDVSTK